MLPAFPKPYGLQQIIFAMIHSLDLHFMGLAAENVSASAIRKAWLRTALRTHPDKGAPDSAEFLLAKNIYDDISAGWSHFEALKSSSSNGIRGRLRIGICRRSDASATLSDYVVDNVYLSRFCLFEPETPQLDVACNICCYLKSRVACS